MENNLSKKLRRRNLCLALGLGLAVFAFVSYRIFYPVFTVSWQSLTRKNLAEIEGKHFVKIKMRYGYPFHKVKIRGKFLKERGEKTAPLKNIYQNELAIYKKGEEIKTLSDLKKRLALDSIDGLEKGILLSDGRAVYFVGDGEYRAFANAETFDQLGFDWNKVRLDKNDFLSKLKKGSNITLTTFYLPYSFAQIGEQIYLLGNHVKYPLNEDDDVLRKYVVDNFSVIKVDKRMLEKLSDFCCRRKSDDFVCVFKDRQRLVFPRADLILEFDKEALNKHLEIAISTFARNDWNAPKITLRRAKMLFLLRYGHYFNR